MGRGRGVCPRARWDIAACRHTDLRHGRFVFTRRGQDPAVLGHARPFNGFPQDIASRSSEQRTDTVSLLPPLSSAPPAAVRFAASLSSGNGSMHQCGQLPYAAPSCYGLNGFVSAGLAVWVGST